jgi:hypothetical protein
LYAQRQDGNVRPGGPFPYKPSFSRLPFPVMLDEHGARVSESSENVSGSHEVLPSVDIQCKASALALPVLDAEGSLKGVTGNHKGETPY